MLRIHQLFFINILALFTGTLLIASIIGYYTLKEMIIEDTIHNLKRAIELVAPKSSLPTDPDHFVNVILNQTGYRATLFNAKAEVIGESNIDKRSVISGINRIEVMHAATEDYGIAARHSETFDEDYIFVAKQVPFAGDIAVIRLGVPLQNVMEHFYRLWLKLAGSFALFILIALLVAYRISKKTRYDIFQITHYLHEISDKNYNAALKPEHFQEFLYISIMLKNLVKKLRNREKQKRKYTARLRLINKQQNDVLSAISHEFKNPIAAIMGYTETLHDDLELDPKIREKFLAKILTNTRKITDMLDRLALSVKLENNDLSIKPSLFDLGEVCTDAISVLKGKYPLRELRYEGISKRVYADKTMIELVITNLIDNAMKYSEDAVTLTLDEHSIHVIDKGIGISASDLENITSKFYRVQKNSWDNSMGLGLAIVTYILKLHNTALTIESTPGKGSDFGFLIDAMLPPLLPSS